MMCNKVALYVWLFVFLGLNTGLPVVNLDKSKNYIRNTAISASVATISWFASKYILRNKLRKQLEAINSVRFILNNYMVYFEKNQSKVGKKQYSDFAIGDVNIFKYSEIKKKIQRIGNDDIVQDTNKLEKLIADDAITLQGLKEFQEMLQECVDKDVQGKVQAILYKCLEEKSKEALRSAREKCFEEIKQWTFSLNYKVRSDEEKTVAKYLECMFFADTIKEKFKCDFVCMWNTNILRYLSYDNSGRMVVPTDQNNHNYRLDFVDMLVKSDWLPDDEKIEWQKFYQELFEKYNISQ